MKKVKNVLDRFGVEFFKTKTEESYSPTAIADICKVSTQTVQRYLKMHGIERPEHLKYKSYKISSSWSDSARTKREFNPPVKWVEEKIAAGYSYRKIAEECPYEWGCGFGRKSVKDFIEKHNISYTSKRAPYKVSIEWMKEELKTKTIGRIAEEQKRDHGAIEVFIERHNLRSFVLRRGIGRDLENPNRWDGHPVITGSYWGKLIGGAKKRKITFDITPDKAYEIFEKQNGLCALSGFPIVFGPLSHQTPTDERPLQTASLDRINSDLKIYNIDNCQWVHAVVNLMKNQNSEEELLRLVKQIYLHNSL